MKPSLWNRMDSYSRQIVPVMTTLVLVVVGLIPLHISGFSGIAPAFALMAVFHWGIYRPELMPVFSVFLLGIFADALYGTPFGLHPLVYLGVYGAVTFQHGFFMDKSFAVVWLAFSLVAAASAVISFIMVSAVSGAMAAPGPAFLQFFFTAAFFPALSWGMSGLHRLVME